MLGRFKIKRLLYIRRCCYLNEIAKQSRHTTRVYVSHRRCDKFKIINSSLRFGFCFISELGDLIFILNFSLPSAPRDENNDEEKKISGQRGSIDLTFFVITFNWNLFRLVCACRRESGRTQLDQICFLLLPLSGKTPTKQPDRSIIFTYLVSIVFFSASDQPHDED